MAPSKVAEIFSVRPAGLVETGSGWFFGDIDLNQRSMRAAEISSRKGIAFEAGVSLPGEEPKHATQAQ
jgi:hypothetical protein